MAHVRDYRFDEAVIRITKQNGERLAVFDVSETVYYRWIAVGSNQVYLLYTFYDHPTMLEWVAKHQINGAKVEGDDLNNFVSGDGFDTWEEFVNSQRPDGEEEFPTYVDAQGNEHAEY